MRIIACLLQRGDDVDPELLLQRRELRVELVERKARVDEGGGSPPDVVDLQQSLPLLRLDGFYIISDLTGVPDMLTRIKPVLRGLVPGREPDPRVTELKTWVRGVVTGYVCTVVPAIGLLFLLMLVHAPRAFATGYDSFALHYARVGPDFARGETGRGILNLFEMVMLVLPLTGMVYTTARIGKRAGVGAWNWSSVHPARRGSLVLATAAAAAAVAFVWWPHGEYRPIQPGEKGTLVSAFRGLRHIPSGHGALTPGRARQLGGAPFAHDRAAAREPNAPHDKAAPRTSHGTRPTTSPTTPAGNTWTTTTPSAAAPPTTTTEPGTTTPPPTGITPPSPSAPAAAAAPGAPPAPAGSRPAAGTSSAPAATPPPTSTAATTPPPGTTPPPTSTTATTEAPAVTTAQTTP